MKEENEKRAYNIGLDIGTASVGWAVMYSDNFKIVKKGDSKLWGVRLFEQAKSAQERRIYRSTRRRYDRRRNRIKLLQDIFKDEILKTDEKFYQKLKETFYNKNDFNKTIKITLEEKKMIKKYNDKYPTIYHLRNELIKSKEKKDIRLVYLALHHIIKYRGNFLYNSESFNVDNLDIKEKLKSTFNNIITVADNLGFDEDNIENINFNKLNQALLNESKKDKELLIKKVFKSFENKNFVSEFTKLMIGNKAKVAKMMCEEVETDISISFKGTDYEDKYDEINKMLENKMEILESFKELYDMVFLKTLFKGEKYTSISELMISKFDKHKEDLKVLKKILSSNRCEYNKILRTVKKDKCLYDQYLHNKLTYQEFVSKVKKSVEASLKNITDKKLVDYYYNVVLKEMDNESFLPRITTSDNGKYPYQLNLKELDLIIKNQGKYYPFLLEKINDTYKIEKILTFRIPYYVGPLNNTTNNKDKKNPNSWMVRKNNDAKITPYNFEEVVDLDASAEKFITRMISNCTYIINEPSMPADSILYSKYKVYNELKQIKINDERLTVDIINKIYNELFLQSEGTITNKVFVNYLKTLDEFSMDTDFNILGYSTLNKFSSNMKSYVDFFGKNGIFLGTNYTLENAEEIINWITIFEDKKILERKLKDKYHELSDRQIRMILAKKYKGWSHLSQKLLTTKYYIDKETSEKKSIMDLLVETKYNFMQIINNKKYNFQKMINEFNLIDDTKKLDYSVVADLATSPATKRGIYQALKIVQELVEYIGYEPENIMVEMAREDGEKIRTKSRKKTLLEYYKKAKDGIDNYNNLFKELNAKEEDKFDNEKLYLYFLQEGKSLYSGTPLNIDKLNSYEVDHIIPRSLIKDDSFDNKALVLGEENQVKANSFVLPEQFRKKENILWWERLKKHNMMSEKKLNNLKRYKYSDEDINGFINRQIVETRQITKHVANILNNFYKKTKVIYLKANFSSDFRSKFEIFKYRSLNDFHHAHDAYLAAALGYYKEKVFKDVSYEKLKESNREAYQSGKYRYDKRFGYIINNIDPEIEIYDKETGEILIDNKAFINTVVKTLYNSDILVSKKTEIRTGQFYEQNISKRGTKAAPLRNSLSTELYGGYSGVCPSYAVVVNYTKKGKDLQKMIGIPIYIDKLNSESKKIEYIKSLLSLSENDTVRIIKDKIPFYSTICWDGQICSLVGATSRVEVCNAKEFIIDKKHLYDWRYTLNKVLNGKNTNKITPMEYDNQLSQIVIYIVEKIEKEYKLYENLLEQMKTNFKINNIENLSTKEKEIIIVQMLKLLKFNSENANLKEIDSKLSSTFGRKAERTIEHGIIIYQSVTGLRKDTYEF